MSNFFFVSNSLDAFYNQALESALLDAVPDDGALLYLWRNERTVVVGRNQNAAAECDIALLESEGGRLARRRSGGGAVYHDAGNLNFTFIAARRYDTALNNATVLAAMCALGVPAQLSGRNDMTAQGRKFSGAAFYSSGGKKLHHGTLLVAPVMADVPRYLRAGAAKLRANGVASVAARVCCLSEFVPGLGVDRVAAALKEEFSRCFRGELSDGGALVDSDSCARWQRFFTADNWRYGSQQPFSLEYRTRLQCGEFWLRCEVENGVVCSAQIFSDALQSAVPPRLAQQLRGCRATAREFAVAAAALAQRCSGAKRTMLREIAAYFGGSGGNDEQL